MNHVTVRDMDTNLKTTLSLKASSLQAATPDHSMPREANGAEHRGT